MALTLSKLFMRNISQNPNENQTGISLWTIEDIEKAQVVQRAQALADEQEKDWAEFGGDNGITDAMLVDLEV